MSERKQQDSHEVAHAAAAHALSKKAEDVTILDLRKLSAAADFFVLASGGSDLHVKAISDAIVEGLEKQSVAIWHVEGYSNRRWVLVDIVTVVVHVFHAEARTFYGLERLWGDAPATRVE